MPEPQQSCPCLWIDRDARVGQDASEKSWPSCAHHSPRDNSLQGRSALPRSPGLWLPLKDQSTKTQPCRGPAPPHRGRPAHGAGASPRPLQAQPSLHTHQDTSLKSHHILPWKQQKYSVAPTGGWGPIPSAPQLQNIREGLSLSLKMGVNCIHSSVICPH